jgi:retinol dehydrogenase 12
MGWFSVFLYSRMLVTLPIPMKDFSGQTVIITGSNTGLGFEVTRRIAQLNAPLIIVAVRNISKGEAAETLILESTKRSAGSIQVRELGMQNYDSIKAFAAKASQLQRIDAVVENAGNMAKHFKIVAGYESTITANVIGTFLLAPLSYQSSKSPYRNTISSHD